MTTWHAELTYQHTDPADQPPADDRWSATDPATGGRRLHLRLTVQAAAAHEAVLAALAAADTAHAAAFGTRADPVDVHVTTETEHHHQLAHPRPLDLVDATEAGQILDVSRQRARQLADTNQVFPHPVGTPGRGPVWTSTSITAFKAAWGRHNRGGRPAKNTPST